MPFRPLADLASLDLSTPVFGREALYEVLSQQGRFALVDGVLHSDLERDLVVGYREVRSDEWWAKDHIPGRPLFPGTLMVEASAQLATFDFHQRRPEVKDAFIGFTGIENTRFRATVEPDCRLLLVCRVARLRSTMFTYDVQGVVDENIVFESRISGMVLKGGKG
ncbi:MAG: hypothetical protein WD226_13900 [Planctomycetota bacterium]